MPTNRPFFSNFLAAFRAHSAIQKASAATPSSSPPNSSQSTYASASSAISQNAASAPRSIATKAGQSSNGATTAAVQAAGHLQTSPLSRSAGAPGPSSHGSVAGSASRQRRGSDSSTEGFRDALGAEKWYIGGRTAGGEERFYKLGMAKRHRSIDRLSLDRLSL
ncbi:hypothetical protein L228DRAFT_265792 [Xylona heveae TC161]|uniref:Uncharacterized protein n=1 Tax=Xylona heveae (strain CBS 132557 / TC161) TaxID=1328760 RepID=A0A161TGL6_XYLHT|nr:hypothetical protein L228DRAFT_265792 [Xylona heveae TC161]KZF25317.1 hypothetical protein L228DRAFT_265792 [Xylona heveae TC161]